VSAKNKVILYSYYRSSASYRVRIGLALKGLEVEYHGVHLLKDGGQQRTSDYAQINPMLHVPSLRHGDFVLSESMAILKYLDHLEASPRLFPEDSQVEARVIQICEFINSGIQPLQNLKVLQHLESLGLDKKVQSEWTQHWIRKGLASVETLLKETSKSHCVGADWTAADCFLIAQAFSSRRFGVEMDSYPTIHKILNHLESHPAVLKAHPDNQPDSE
tara:strand:- start:111 stop:764 length:654 start_codon:yes stop_codon:yes gene_type:complete